MTVYRYSRLFLVLGIISILVAGCTRSAGSSSVMAEQGSLSSLPVIPQSLSTETPIATSTETHTPLPLPTETPLPPTQTPIPTPTPESELTLMAVGDLMLARSIGERIVSEGPAAPFMGVISALKQADILAGNLECAIATTGKPVPKSYNFQAPLKAAEGLALAGFDLVSMANNHALDFGKEAMSETLDVLAKQNVAVVGAGLDARAARAPLVITHNHLRVAFLAYVDVPIEGKYAFDTHDWIAGVNSPGINWANPRDIEADVSAAKEAADVVVVMLHAGTENTRRIEAIQRELAHRAIEAGAALVLGSHSHVLQGVENYEGGVIAYSLGNFVFDEFGLPMNYSAIFSAKLTSGGVDSYEWIPVMIEDGFPRLAKPDEAEEVRQMVKPIN
jgi:poly-gamma-glutamate capsule biosynthesis protein CapA/YwtB (metallophosphatase superfamily)